MIRILQVIGGMGSGGAETMLMNLYRNIDRERVQFDFLVHTDRVQFYDEEIQALGGRIYRTCKFNGKNYISYRRFWDSFLEQHREYRIIHGHINSSAAIYLSCAKRHGRIAIAHSHNTRSAKRNLRAYASRMAAYPLKYIADYFFGCGTQAGIDRFGDKVVASDRFYILRNSVDTKKFHYNPDIRRRMRLEYHIREDRLVIGHVGRFSAQKNHEFLIKIFAMIVQKVPDAKLWLLGEGELQEKIKKQVEEMGLLENVSFMGTTDKVQDYLQAMDVFLFPSLHEGVSVALIEAQATGLPCAVARNALNEADIGAGLIYKLQLKDKIELWADTALEACRHTRKDTSAYVISAGFDIRDSARWLQDFYLNLKLDR